MNLADNSLTLLFVLDIVGTLAFAVDGGLVAVRRGRIDLIGVVLLSTVTAVGGGIIRDLLLGLTPPASLSDWRYLVVAGVGGLVAFTAGMHLDRMGRIITIADAFGLSLFAVVGASKALDYGLNAVAAVLIGSITAVGGGTLRDVMLGRVPTILTPDNALYASPAILAAVVVTVGDGLGVGTGLAAVSGALACFVFRMLSVHFEITAPESFFGPDRTNPPHHQ